MKHLFTIVILINICMFACSVATTEEKEAIKDSINSEMSVLHSKEIKYLALGDSYTIGESVDSASRWPVLLSDSLKKDGYTIISTDIIATTGWTTEELIKAVQKENINGPFGLVSLLIGVNNQYREYDTEVFENDVRDLINIAISYANNDPKRVFIVSIPDYGVTRFGSKRDPEKIGIEIDYYNNVKAKIAKEMGVEFIDVTPISRQAKHDPSLVADDDLHPSSKQYRLWLEQIYPKVKSLLDAGADIADKN